MDTVNRSNLVSRYIEDWKETDSDRRQSMLNSTWEPDGSYTDPMFAVRGHEEIGGLITGFQHQYPDLRFVHTVEVESHHNLARFTWELVTLEGHIVAKGMDVVLVATDGRLTAVAGFFDQAPDLG